MITEHEGSLVKMVKQLVKDAQSKIDSNNFLCCMENFNKKYYSFSAKYKEERKKTISGLF